MKGKLTSLWARGARLLLLAVGVMLVMGQALQARQIGAPAREAFSPLLSVLVFAGALFWLLPGGLVGAACATAAYGVLQARGHAPGPPSLTVQVFSHGAIYFFYAAFVGLGAGHLQDRLQKLELADRIDPITELYNGSFFAQTVGVEISRSGRYGRSFSITGVDVPHAGFVDYGKRGYRTTLRTLGNRISSSLRGADSPVRVNDGDTDRFFVILPETGWEGAEVFTRRLEEAVRVFLAERGYGNPASISARSLSYPEDADAIVKLREEIAALSAALSAAGRGRTPAPLPKVASGT